jgi:O-antigen ligase
VKLRLIPTQIAVLLVMLIAPIWLKWPLAPPPFTGNYVLGFVISALIMLCILLWVFTKFHGWRNLFSSYWRIAFLVCLILLTGWMILSQEWAYGRNIYAGMAETTALQMIIVMGFAIVVMAVSPPLHLIFLVLIVSMLIHGTIGLLQVYFQHSLGLAWLGEFTLSTTQSGVSVLEADGLRWLRPYGLSPHPNILAGIIVLGLLASTAFVAQGKQTILSSLSFLLGLFFLLLTFSRGAWLGFAFAALFALPFLMREAGFWRRILPLFSISVLITLIFVWVYQPFLLSRTGLSEENTEQRSISDRLVYMEIAWDAIESYPMQGVGAGNFPWYASNYLFYRTDYDLKGNNVHNIYLTVWAELGIVGIALFLGMLATGIIATLRNRSPQRIMLLVGVLAWAIIGFVDHYMWTLILSQSLWLGLLAAAIAKAPESPYNEEKHS